MSKSINEQIAVMKAFADGKDIEVFRVGRWGSDKQPVWDWQAYDYRVALKPLPQVGDVLMIGTSAGFNHDTVVIVWSVDEVNRTFGTYNQLDCYDDPLTIYRHKADERFSILAHIGN